MTAAEGAHVVTAGGSQMGHHVAVVGAIDHGGVAKQAAESHGCL
jgi:hypothetical protein